MKEFTFTLTSKVLSRGLYREVNPGIDVVELEQAKNVRAWRGRLAKWQPLRNPIDAATLISGGLELAFPHPQLRRGKHRLFMFHKDRIFYVDPVSYTPLEIDVRDINDTTQLGTINTGDYWHLADFGDYWYAFNGNSTVIHHNQFRMEGKEDVAVVDNSRFINAGVDFNGRVIIGGLSEEFWGFWESFFEGKASSLYSGFTYDMPAGSDYILWSNIGVDIWWLFYTTKAQESLISGYGYDADRPYLYDLLMRNDLGFARVPMVGFIQRIVPLYSNMIVVYGDNGLAIYKQYSEPAPTFGLVLSIPVGLPHQGAVASNGFEHVFLGNDGALYMLQSDLQFTRLGYEHIFAGNIDLPHIVSFDRFRGDYYISNQNGTWVLSQDGLTYVTQVITSVVDNYGEPVALGSNYVDDREVVLRTTAMTFGRPGLKHIGHVRLMGQDLDKYSVALEYLGSDGMWYTSSYKPVNSSGVVYMGVTSEVFKLVVRADDFDDVGYIESIDLSVKYVDKRFVRGVNVTQINS